MGVLITNPKYPEYEVEVIADSYVYVPKELNPVGYERITTLRARFARFVLAEANTHRLLSRNSASSRAIPAKTMRKRVMEHPFVPDRFPEDHKGMQANVWIEQETRRYRFLRWVWLFMRTIIVFLAAILSRLNVSKQLANRLIEPFTMHEALITATEWENFLSLRAHEDAQNEIRICADMILEALNQSEPKRLDPGEWHIPFSDNMDEDQIWKIAIREGHGVTPIDRPEEIMRMIATARAARVSYANFEGVEDYTKDIAMYNRLASSGHWSPFEHVARAMTPEEYQQYSHTYPDHTEHGWCGNFRGFIQLRKTFPRNVENRPEPRIRILQL